MSAATIDRRLARERAGALELKGRCTVPSRDRCSRVRSRCGPGPTGTTPCPGSSRSTRCRRNTDGGNAGRTQCAYTLTVTDIATGVDREPVSARARPARACWRALKDVAGQDAVPDPGRGLLTTEPTSSTPTCWRWCEEREITFTRARPGNQERRVPRRAEELGGGPHRGRLTTATTPPQSCCYSTRSGSCSPS